MHYHGSGKETDGIRKALQSWFVMQYLVYILNIFTDVVSVVKPIFRGDLHQQEWEIWAHSASILYAVVSIFLPYLLALWMIDTHRKYYAEMSEKHLLTDSKDPTPDGDNSARTPNAEVPTPYAEISKELLLKDGAPTQKAKHCYIAEVNARKIKPCLEYDFCPQILGVTVPVTSPGYAVSIFLALFTLVAKFIT